MKLEATQIIPYVSYGLKVKSKRHFCKYGEETILKVNGIAFQDTAEIHYWQYEFVFDNDLKFANINEKGFKPILRPLSYLTKEIEVNGEKFVPHIKLGGRPNLKDYDIEYLSNHINDMSFGLIKQLIEWHFDVFGLIEKGLAIDFNETFTQK